MQTRLGALAIVAVLSACSGPGSDTKSGVPQAQGLTAEKATAGMGTDGLVALSRKKARTLGSAPDKGELFTYDNKIGVKHQGAYTLRPVRLSEEHAFRGMATGLMTVPAPDGSQIKIRYERHEESPDGNWSWIGKVIGGDVAQEAIFTFGEEAVFGSIPQASGPALRLTTKGGVAYLIQADTALLKQGVREGGDVKVRPRSAADIQDSDSALVAMAKVKAATQAKADVSTKAFNAANTIDLVVGYTNGFVTANNGASAAATRLSFLLTVANQALLNSNVNARIRVVQALQVTYADATDNGDALDQLTGHDGTTPSTPPASLLPLRAARDQYGADLVTLVRDFQPQNNGCGIAWQIGANGQNITVAGDAPFGYSVVSDGDYEQSGNTYYCEDVSMVHELAHNMGSAHDAANAGTISGRYPYSYGYKTTATTGNFFTVMAYGDDNQQIYRVFSNPLITTCGGLACGVANQADNARSLTQTIPVVSGFRAVVVPIITTLVDLYDARNYDVNGDGKSDLLWNLDAGGQWAYWTMDGPNRTGGVGYGVGNSWYVVATGDFRGDDRLDVIWSNGADMQLWDGSGASFAGVAMQGYPTGYEVMAVGDLNADGRDDLVWRNAAGAVGTWLMNGPSVIGSASYNVAPTWRIVGSGDMNGDNRLDIVWTDNSVMQLWIGSASGFSGAAMPAYPTGWNMVGIGDVNGDNFDDLLWRYPPTGEIAYWRMSGATRVSGVGFAASTAWRPVQVADFTGDGRVDIVWTNGQLMQMWISQGNAFSGAAMVGYPASWTAIRR